MGAARPCICAPRKKHPLPKTHVPSLPTSSPSSFPHSVLLLDYALLPAFRLLLAPLLGPTGAGTLSAALVGAYHLLWLLPAYAISFLINCIWCAALRCAVIVMHRQGWAGLMADHLRQGGC